MKEAYTFSFPSFIKGEFLTKLARVNKKLAGMKDANEVQILTETLESRSILKPEPRKKALDTRHLKKDHGRYIPSPEDYMDVVFSIVEVSLPVQTKIQGFQLAGTINIEGDVKTIHALNDDVNLSEVDVKACHHCGVRRKRNRLHVFTEVQTGDHKAIGSTCVHEYIGLDIDKILHTFFNFYKEDDLYGSKGMRDAWGFPTIELANAVRATYVEDPTYKKAFRDSYNSTKSSVDMNHRIMYHNNEFDKDSRENLHKSLDNAPKVGSLLVETYGDLDASSSNFNSNVVETLFYTDDQGTKVLRDFIVGKARGIFIWAIYNALNKSKEAKVQKTKPVSHHKGEIGEFIRTSGVVKVAKSCDTPYGTSRLLVVSGKDGSEVKAFTTKSSAWDYNVGDDITMGGTVSKHEEFKGNKSTMVKRITFS